MCWWLDPTCPDQFFFKENAVAKYNPLTKHHRKPKSMQGGNNRENISIVPENKHAAYHLLFNEGRVDYIVKVLNNTWIDPEYELFFRREAK